jgi:chromosome segregation ATPase
MSEKRVGANQAHVHIDEWARVGDGPQRYVGRTNEDIVATVLASFVEGVERLRGESASLAAERDDLKRKWTQACEDHGAALHELDKARAELATLRGERDDLLERLTNAEERNASLATVVEQLRSESEKQSAASAELHRQLNAGAELLLLPGDRISKHFVPAVRELRDRNALLAAEVARLREERDEFEHSSDAGWAVVQTARTQAREAHEERDEARRERDEAQALAGELRAELATLRGEGEPDGELDACNAPGPADAVVDALEAVADARDLTRQAVASTVTDAAEYSVLQSVALLGNAQRLLEAARKADAS